MSNIAISIWLQLTSLRNTTFAAKQQKHVQYLKRNADKLGPCLHLATTVHIAYKRILSPKPISGRLDNASATETVDAGSIFGQVIQNIIV